MTGGTKVGFRVYEVQAGRLPRDAIAKPRGAQFLRDVQVYLHLYEVRHWRIRHALVEVDLEQRGAVACALRIRSSDNSPRFEQLMVYMRSCLAGRPRRTAIKDTRIEPELRIRGSGPKDNQDRVSYRRFVPESPSCVLIRIDNDGNNENFRGPRSLSERIELKWNAEYFILAVETPCDASSESDGSVFDVRLDAIDVNPTAYSHYRADIKATWSSLGGATIPIETIPIEAEEQNDDGEDDFVKDREKILSIARELAAMLENMQPDLARKLRRFGGLRVWENLDDYQKARLGLGCLINLMP